MLLIDLTSGRSQKIKNYFYIFLLSLQEGSSILCLGWGGGGWPWPCPPPPSPLFTTVHQHEVTEKREVSKQW